MATTLTLFADVDVSIGVILMMAGITFLVIVLIALALIEASAEHSDNVRREHHHEV